MDENAITLVLLNLVDNADLQPVPDPGADPADGRGASFKITTTTGGEPGGGKPASFPSIYIGANGDTQNGNFSTSSDDMLPKQVSTLQSVNSNFRYSKASGDYNATYDIWFSQNKPTQRYDDGIS